MSGNSARGGSNNSGSNFAGFSGFNPWGSQNPSGNSSSQSGPKSSRAGGGQQQNPFEFLFKNR